jgi:hypothetical protein
VPVGENSLPQGISLRRGARYQPAGRGYWSDSAPIGIIPIPSGREGGSAHIWDMARRTGLKARKRRVRDDGGDLLRAAHRVSGECVAGERRLLVCLGAPGFSGVDSGGSIGCVLARGAFGWGIAWTRLRRDGAMGKAPLDVGKPAAIRPAGASAGSGACCRSTAAACPRKGAARLGRGIRLHPPSAHRGVEAWAKRHVVKASRRMVEHTHSWLNCIS